MTVYFMRRKLDGAVKIGFTDRDPMARLREIQNAAGLELELLVSIEGDRRDEHQLHDDFAQYRQHGEWFTACEDLVELIDFHVYQQSPRAEAIRRRCSQRYAIAAELRRYFSTDAPEGHFAKDWADELADVLISAAVAAQ